MRLKRSTTVTGGKPRPTGNPDALFLRAWGHSGSRAPRSALQEACRSAPHSRDPSSSPPGLAFDGMAMPIPMVAAVANMSVLMIIFISFALHLRNAWRVVRLLSAILTFLNPVTRWPDRSRRRPVVGWGLHVGHLKGILTCTRSSGRLKHGETKPIVA